MTIESRDDANRMAARLEGRAAFHGGVPFDECPPFVIEDLARKWRCGWQEAHDRRKARDEAK